MDSGETTSSSQPTPTQTPPPSQPTEPTPPPQPSPQTLPSPSSTSPPPPPQNPNPNSTQNPNQSTQPLSSSSTPLHHQLQQQQQQQQQQQTATTRPPVPPSHLNRPRPQQAFSQYGSSHIPSSSSSSTPVSSPSISAASSLQRGGLAIGVPAHQPRPSQPTPFSSFGPSSFNQTFGGLPSRTSVNDTNQVKQPIQGIQTIGMMGSLSSGSQIRQTGMIPQHHPQRGVQPSMRPQSTSTNQSLASQKFHGQGLLRAQSTGSPSTPSPGTPQGLQPHTQPWMSSATQGKQMHPPTLPSSSFRQQMKPQSLQQRSHLPQQHHQTLPASSSHQQMAPSQQQHQSSVLHQSQDHYGQQYPPPRSQQAMPHQQLTPRGPGPGSQKSATVTTGQSPITQSGTASLDTGESGDHILGKRCIHELVSQVDPLEKFDPELENILMEFAEDFVDSITTFGCSLAKHRKSTTLEAKDILLHLEKNWNMTLPGFGGDEIKSFKKQSTNDIHKERLAAVKKSMVGSDSKSIGGQSAGNAKGHAAKPPATGEAAVGPN